MAVDTWDPCGVTGSLDKDEGFGTPQPRSLSSDCIVSLRMEFMLPSGSRVDPGVFSRILFRISLLWGLYRAWLWCQSLISSNQCSFWIVSVVYCLSRLLFLIEVRLITLDLCIQVYMLLLRCLSGEFPSRLPGGVEYLPALASECYLFDLISAQKPFTSTHNESAAFL